MVKNCDLGLENAALGLRPRAAFSRPRSQFFTIRTSQPANNIYILSKWPLQVSKLHIFVRSRSLKSSNNEHYIDEDKSVFHFHLIPRCQANVTYKCLKPAKNANFSIERSRGQQQKF